MKVNDLVITNFGTGSDCEVPGLCIILAVEKENDPRTSPAPSLDMGRYTIQAMNGDTLSNAPGYLMKLVDEAQTQGKARTDEICRNTRKTGEALKR